MSIFRLLLIFSGLLIITSSLNITEASILSLLKGNREYRYGNYSRAIDNYKKYRGKAKNAKDATTVNFNLGNSYYKLEDYRKAIEYYRASLTGAKRKRKGIIHYNIGNAYYKLGLYEEAVKEYIEALQLLPYNTKMKQNLELAISKLKAKKRSTKKTAPPQNSKNKNRQPSKVRKDEKSYGSKEQPLNEEETERLFRSLDEYHKSQIQTLIKNVLKSEDSSDEKGW